MRQVLAQVLALFGVSSAVTVLAIKLKLIYALQVALGEATTGNYEVLGGFILVGMVAFLAVQFLTLTSASR